MKLNDGMKLSDIMVLANAIKESANTISLAILTARQSIDNLNTELSFIRKELNNTRKEL